jgi:hypothetical protein
MAEVVFLEPDLVRKKDPPTPKGGGSFDKEATKLIKYISFKHKKSTQYSVRC